MAALFGAIMIACGAQSGSDSDGTGQGGIGFAVPGAGDAGLLQPAGGATGKGNPTLGADGKTCGFEQLPLERLPAELLLVLDRSTSMITDRLQNAETNWTVLTRALDGTINKTQAGVLWGLKTFPTTSACGVQGGVEHDVAVNNYAAINATVMRSTPGNNNGTPTTAAMNAATNYLKGRTTQNPKYLLLATDGEPTCFNGNGSRNSTDIPAAIAAVGNAAQEGFHTFVVGIAPQRQVGRALETLNAMAVAGAEPRAGDTKFFSVTSEAELSAALEAIAGQVGSCTFSLSKAPPSPDDVAVDIDGKRIARSDVDGWQYNAAKTSIVLNGALCEAARKGSLKRVEITFGCAGVAIPVL
ncbi:MAG: vWA domain-containing protein [Deltaproteobacteria bacterium]|nr:vWA domain-containing protein [Deltaproteobacteria bacterium]